MVKSSLFSLSSSSFHQNLIKSFLFRHHRRLLSRLSSVNYSKSNKKMEIPSETKMHHYETHPNIVWADCEMSGLNVDHDHLLEVAIIITDSDLTEIDSLGPLVIKTDPNVLSSMDEWCIKNHTKTGLYQACLSSQLTINEADQRLYDMLNCQQMKLAVLAGNSIGYDKLFLKKYCPKFSSLLHYRTIDVSSFKEIIRRWYPNEPLFKKKLRHRALDDIRESIDEMKFYRSKYFKDPIKL